MTLSGKPLLLSCGVSKPVTADLGLQNIKYSVIECFNSPEAFCMEVSLLPSLLIFSRNRDTWSKPSSQNPGTLSPCLLVDSTRNPASTLIYTSSVGLFPIGIWLVRHFGRQDSFENCSDYLQASISASYRYSLRFSPELGRAASAVV